MSRPAVQQIATVLVTYARIVPTGGSRNRAEAELNEIFGRVEENAPMLPSNGPNSTVWAAFAFIKSLTRGLGMLEPNFCSQRGPFSYAELGERPSFL